MDSKYFETKQQYNTYQKTAKKQKIVKTPSPAKTPDLQTPVGDKKLSPQEKASIERIKAKVQQNLPTERFELYYKTTTHSKIAIIIIRPKNYKGEEMWNVKAEHLVGTMPYYVDEFPHENPLIQFALKNLMKAVMRDLSAPSTKGKENTSKTTNKEKKQFKQYVAYTHINLPTEDLESKDDEMNFLTNFCNDLGLALKQIQVQPAYLAVLENSVKPKFWEYMEKPKSGMSFIEFVEAAKVKVEEAGLFVDHVIQDDSRNMTNLLWSNRLNKRKYPDPALINSDDESGDDDDSDQQPKTNEEDPNTPKKNDSNDDSDDNESKD